MVRYDSEVLYTFAERSETTANAIIFLGVVMGLLIGAVGGYMLIGGAVSTTEIDYLPTIVGGIIGAAIGCLIGLEQAFRVRLGVHTLLCQVQIEENTRTSNASWQPLDQSAQVDLAMRHGSTPGLLSMPAVTTEEPMISSRVENNGVTRFSD